MEGWNCMEGGRAKESLPALGAVSIEGAREMSCWFT